MAITVRDVAIAAGVSQATAARALNGHGAVSPEALTKVTSAAEKLGYQTNRVAQALRLGQTRTVGFIPGDLENPFFATVARHLGDTLQKRGYTLLVASSDEDPKHEQQIIETLRTHLVSGFVVAPASAAKYAHLKKLKKDGVPLVFVDRAVDAVDADSVTVDNERGARQALDHLVGLGHTRIGMISDNLQIASSVERTSGFLQDYERRGLPPRSRLIEYGDSSRQGGYDAAMRMLSGLDRPTALFAGDNFMTMGALRAANDLDISIPRDLTLVGFDDFDLATIIRPTVSVIAQPVSELGIQAALILMERMDGYTGPSKSVKLNTELIVRESSAGPATV